MEDSSTAAASQPTRWRDHLKVHPAADLFPPMSSDELLALGEDIKANGGQPQVKVVIFTPQEGEPLLLDGRNRLDAMELVGLPAVTPAGVPAVSFETIAEHDGFNPFVFVISANWRRRHLTGDQRDKVIWKLKAERPELSTRLLAEMTGTSQSTVQRGVSRETAGEPNGSPQSTVTPDPEPEQVEAAPDDPPTPVAGEAPAAPIEAADTPRFIPDDRVEILLPERVIGKDGRSYPAKAATKKAATPAKAAPTAKEANSTGSLRAKAIEAMSGDLGKLDGKALADKIETRSDSSPMCGGTPCRKAGATKSKGCCDR